jgi:hypothetical protein
MTRDEFGGEPRKPGRDPFGTARKYGLHLRARERRGAMLRGDRIYYDGTASLAEQRAMISSCIARYVLRKTSPGSRKSTAA